MPRNHDDAWLRRLRIAGIVLPVAFIVALQALRPLVSSSPLPEPGEGFLDALTAVAAIVFGLVMFRRIDVGHRTVMHRNRELAIRDAVATAVRDAGTDERAAPIGAAAAEHADPVGRVVDAALDATRTTSGAAAVRLTLTPEHDTARRRAPVTRFDPGAPAGPVPPSAGGADDHYELAVPLLAGTTEVGTMTLTFAVADPPISSATITTVGQQIGSAVHRAVLQTRLERAHREQRAISDVLLHVSAQRSLATTLHALVGTAASLTGAARAGLCLQPTAPGVGSLVSAADGAAHPGPLCVTPSLVHSCDLADARCPMSLQDEVTTGSVARTDVHGSDGPLGELWILGDGRRDLSDADRIVLADLAELATVAVDHARMMDTERGLAATEERDRIAREMHDSLAQVLGVLHLRLRALDAHVAAVQRTTGAGRGDADAGAAEPAGASDPTLVVVRSEATELADIAHDAYTDVREAILGLRESTRPDRSFVESLEAYAAKFSRQSGIATTVDSSAGRDLALAPAVEVQVIRVVQEALTNVRKHAQARTATVRVVEDGETTVVEVVDDGRGFAPGAPAHDRETFGLSSMRERTELVHGRFDLDSAPGRGTRVRVRVPRTGSLDHTRTAPSIPARPGRSPARPPASVAPRGCCWWTTSPCSARPSPRCWTCSRTSRWWGRRRTDWPAWRRRTRCARTSSSSTLRCRS